MFALKWAQRYDVNKVQRTKFHQMCAIKGHLALILRLLTSKKKFIQRLFLFQR
jgi:hypothetical protein